MSRPNLLFIYTDEQRYDTLAACGNTRIQMPNLNRLAQRSTVFERTYVTQPVCTPSRSSLLTGAYPHTNGCVKNNVPLRPDCPCLPEMLPAGVYSCAHHGKWHLGDEIYPQHGFTEWQATDDTYHRFYSARHSEYADRSAYHHWLVQHGVSPRNAGTDTEAVAKPWIRDRFFREQLMALPEPHSRPAFLADTATQFIHRNNGRPWVLYVNFLEPHMPFHSCRDAQYAPGDVLVPPNLVFPGDGATLKSRLRAERLRRDGYEGQPLATEQNWRELTARYWGMCSLVDTYAGKILDELEQTGQDGNTIVVFTSDHGDMMGSHRLLAKTYMYEESTRVPFMIHLPGQKSSRAVTAPVSQVDIVPTLLDLMEVPLAGRLEGRSLRGLVEGTETAPARDVFVEWHSDTDGTQARAAARELLPEVDVDAVVASLADSIRTVVTAEGLKLNWSACGEHELFDLNKDPHELHNLYRESNPALILDLTERIRGWQATTGDNAWSPSGAP